MTAGPALTTIRDPHLRDAWEVARELGVDPERGLDRAEAARRLDRHGPNELRSGPEEPWWRMLLRQFQDPFVYLLLVAMAISLAAWALEGAVGVPVDPLVIAAIVVLNAVIGYLQEHRAEDAVAALATMTAATSTVLRDGRLHQVPSAELVPGDLLVLAEGDAVGADGRLLTATGLRVQEASLTGESEAVAKDPAVLAGATDLGDRRNLVFKGTAVVSGVGRAVVTSTGMATQVGSIAQLLDDTTAESSPLRREVSSISRMLGLAVVIIAITVMAVLFGLSGVRTIGEAVSVLLLGVSLAVAAVPEGLPAILSLVLAVGVRRLAERNAVMKELYSVETLGSASVICSDKTGTLTRNEMTLRTVLTASGELELTGSGYLPDGEALPTDEAVRREALLVLTGGAVANNAQFAQDDEGTWGVTGDPTEAAFLVAAHKLEGVQDRVEGYRRLTELPFTSERKLMSVTAVREPSGTRRLLTKGAPDVLLQRCDTEQAGDSQRPLTGERRAAILADVERLADQGYRTLGVARRPLTDGEESPTERGLTFLGLVGILDPPRAQAKDAVAEAHRAGVRVVMITGDHPVTARRIAADLAIAPAPVAVLTGAELDTLDEAGLRAAVATTSVYARVAPEHKLRLVDALQAGGNIVAMTGDGVNDAPALKSADIGIAMGITGTEVTKQAGRMILGDDNFATIVTAIRLGRGIFDNIRKFLSYLLSSNLGEVITVFLGIVAAEALGLVGAAGPGTLAAPLLATQILWINLVTDSGPALAMGVDPVGEAVMRRPPRRPTDRIIDARLWRQIGRVGLVMGLVTLASLDLVLPGGLFSAGTGSLEQARTAAFTTLVLAQLFNALSARAGVRSAFVGIFDNHWLWVSIVVAALLQVAVVHLPALQTAFGTAPLDLGTWLTCLGLASVVLWVEEGVKLLARLGRGAEAQ